jgi:cation:H+ antiporter
LVVVALALVGGHPALAVGNVIGSCLANLSGSLPLGLLGKRPLVLDRSARVYGLVMLDVTALASLFAVSGRVTRLEGGILVAAFVLYVASVLVVIRRGWLRPPEDDDDDDAGEALATGSILRPSSCWMRAPGPSCVPSPWACIPGPSPRMSAAATSSWPIATGPRPTPAA